MTFEYKTYAKYALKEAISPQIYISAAVIGSIICFLTSNFTIVPFLVPLFVQVLVKSNTKFRNRHQNALVELPSQTSDPAFIMDMQGNIILSIGKTLDLFNRYAVSNIKDFIHTDAFESIIEAAMTRESADQPGAAVEAFSNKSLKWYEIKAKATDLQYGNNERKVLVWFQDISRRKVYHLRLRDLLRYSDLLIDSLKDNDATQAAYDHLAYFLLKEYEAVYITRTDKANNLKGFAFKKEGEKIRRSQEITIKSDSLAPINISRKQKQILSGESSVYPSQKVFLEQNPFDPEVLDFIEVPVRNFITYNEADISIIAFNFRSKITDHEKEFFEVVVNIFRTMVMLVDLKKQSRKND